MSAIAARKLFKHSGTGLIFRGALALLLALAVASLPVATVFALAYVFGIYAMADGLANLAHYYYDPARHSRWSMLGGIASVAVGLVAVSWPGIVVAALALLVGIWGLALGISQIFIALEGRTTISLAEPGSDRHCPHGVWHPCPCQSRNRNPGPLRALGGVHRRRGFAVGDLRILDAQGRRLSTELAET